MILGRLGIGDPSAVGGPGVIPDLPVSGAVHQDDLLVLNVHVEKLQILIRKQKLLAVR